MAHLTDDVAEIRRSLEAYRQLAAELPELMRAADRHDVSISEIARLAGTDRGRVHRAIRTGRDQDPGATRETAEDLVTSVRDGCYVSDGLAAVSGDVQLDYRETSRTVLPAGTIRGQVLMHAVPIGTVWEMPDGYEGHRFEAATAQREHVGDGRSILEALERLAERIARSEQDAPLA